MHKSKKKKFICEKIFKQYERKRFYMQEKYMKEYDDYVVLKDAMNTKYQEGADKGEKRGFQKGMAQGMAQGEKNAHIATARQMKTDGMPIELITQYTGLSAEEIEKL